MEGAGHAVCRCTLGMLLLASFVLPAQSVELSEEHVKSSFIMSFTKHVEWPAGSFKDGASPFVVGVLGSDPIGAAIVTLLNGKTAGNRPLVVKELDASLNALPQWKESHILFICPSQKKRWREILNTLGNSPVLTVADSGRFAQEGGMVNLILDGTRIRMEVNKGNTESARLQLDETMLKASTLVK